MQADLRFHLDEHVATAIAMGLRRRGIDVTTTIEAGLAGASDEEQLRHALSEGRVMVTHDADFLRLHREETDHCGIVYCPQQSRTLGQLLSGLVLLWTNLPAESMKRHVEYL